ncbi:hypothetical protein F5Y16DRAFT_403833 [Xylariaceae sp. FL0255]|nr:hypothetical protein F5Y16DRAFT_403833 [Xylariaceae sp. FL0255]
MRFPNLLTSLAASFMFAWSTQASYQVAGFVDRACQIPLPNTNVSTVLSGTCDTHLYNYSSAIILHKWASPAGTITFLSGHNCGWAPHAIGYGNPDEGTCRDLGFVANAMWLIG